jgi:hypothetical protein
MWESLRNYYLAENGIRSGLPAWHNDHIIAEAEAELDVREGCECAKLCNWDHYQATRGWIA